VPNPSCRGHAMVQAATPSLWQSRNRLYRHASTGALGVARQTSRKMKTFAPLCAIAALALVPATGASAQDNGAIQVKVLGTAVLPDGGITDVEVNALGLAAGSDTRASDSVVPTVAVEYFLSDNFSIETICCVTPHDVRGTGAINGARLVSDAVILPATVTAKLHLPLDAGFKPYIGAGPAYFVIFGEDVDTTATALGLTNVNLSNDLGFALQAGVDIAVNDRGLGLTIDAKRYFVNTTATFSNAAGAVRLRTVHELDPWVVSAGLSYRF
jgi:outer membrane protein